MARTIIGEDNYFEVYVNCSLEECEKRDTKGLYAKARAGEIQDFTGVNAPFEEPENPSLILHTDIESIEDSLNKMVKIILKEIKYSK
jgi:adenylylsulfate kinase